MTVRNTGGSYIYTVKGEMAQSCNGAKADFKAGFF